MSDIDFPKLLDRVCTPFNQVDVIRQGETISFEIAGAAHAEWHPRQQVTGQAWDALAAAALFQPSREAPSILMLGLGGGTGVRIIRTLLPKAKITVVEIDPGMIALARKYMQIDRLNAEIIEADAFLFLRKTHRRFHIVLDDIYLSGATDPLRPATMDAEMITLLQRPLLKGGIVGINLITGAGHRKVQSHARASMLSAFPEVIAIRPPASLNETLVGGQELAPTAIIKQAAVRFPTPGDRLLWEALKTRGLSSNS